MTQTKVSLRLLRFHAQDGDVRVFRRFSVDEQFFFFWKTSENTGVDMQRF